MTLKEFVEAVTRYIAKALSERFSGKIVLTINVHQGGIGNVQVSLNHELTKET
jgi:hypothetical protein